MKNFISWLRMDQHISDDAVKKYNEIIRANANEFVIHPVVSNQDDDLVDAYLKAEGEATKWRSFRFQQKPGTSHISWLVPFGV